MVASAIQLSANHIVDARQPQTSGSGLEKTPKPDDSGKKPQPDIIDGSSKKPDNSI